MKIYLFELSINQISYYTHFILIPEQNKMPISKKTMRLIAELGKNEAMKSPIENRYCAILIDPRDRIVSHAYNTHKCSAMKNNSQCILCS
jgi:hypothetical protein